MSSRSQTTWITRPTIKPTCGSSIRPISPSKPQLAQLLQLHFCLRSRFELLPPSFFHLLRPQAYLSPTHFMLSKDIHTDSLSSANPKMLPLHPTFPLPPSTISAKTGASWLPALQGHLPFKRHGKTFPFSLPPKCCIPCLKVGLLTAIASCTDCLC